MELASCQGPISISLAELPNAFLDRRPGHERGEIILSPQGPVKYRSASADALGKTERWRHRALAAALSHLPSPLERPRQRHRIGILQVTTYRQAARQARHAQA
jgi:hypothetical protein